MFLVNSCMGSLAAAPSLYLPQYVSNWGQLSSDMSQREFLGFGRIY
jgi:hypothetical protein